MCYHPTPKDIQHYIDFGWFEGVYSFILQADPGQFQEKHNRKLPM
jgi:hypothetical protein